MRRRRRVYVRACVLACVQHDIVVWIIHIAPVQAYVCAVTYMCVLSILLVAVSFIISVCARTHTRICACTLTSQNPFCSLDSREGLYIHTIYQPVFSLFSDPTPVLFLDFWLAGIYWILSLILHTIICRHPIMDACSSLVNLLLNAPIRSPCLRPNQLCWFDAGIPCSVCY